MPMNTDGCVVCPENSYCSGGTYRFNETVNQGIASCPNNLYSPVGSSSIDQCGRILHVGDDIVYLRNMKRTTPSLNIKVGDNIYYANITSTPTFMNIDSTHYFKASFGGNEYYICDDTTYEQ
jgi:hypothetical protein